MKYKKFIEKIIILLFISIIFSGCKSDERLLEDLEYSLLSQLDWQADDYLSSLEEGEEDIITIKDIHYGNFSSMDEDELLVLFYVSSPHAGGSDRTIIAIYNKDTLNIKTQKTLAADSVSVYILPSRNGKDYILYIGNTIYQGVPAYSIELFIIQDNEWSTLPVSDYSMDNDLAYTVADNRLLHIMEIHYDEYINPLYQYKYTLYWDDVLGKFANSTK